MCNFEEPSSKEEPSPTPLPSLPDDVAPGVSRSDHAVVSSLFSNDYHIPRVIALKRKNQNLKAMSNLKERAYKKRKKEEAPSWSSLLPPLPDDVALSCLARVPKLDHTALSLLSKSYRCLVASPELYEIRSVMGRTETVVYVCLRTPPFRNPRWYVLRRSKTSSDLIPIPLPIPSFPSEGSSVVAVDSAIYVIGGLIKGKRTGDVFLLDCRTHRWRRVPSMGVAQASAATAVVDGKIYVLGGCRLDDNSLSWGEVFETKTQTWASLPPTPMSFRKKDHDCIHDCVVRDGDVYAVDATERTFYYSPSEGKWGMGKRSEVAGARRDWCMIGDLIFSISNHGRVYWCEQEREGEYRWKEVKGLEDMNGVLCRSRLVHFSKQFVDMYNFARISLGLTRELSVLVPGARLSNSGGNLLLFWDEMVGDNQKIWCSEVSMERRKEGDIWGNIEWSHAVMTLDVDPFFCDRYKVLHSVSVTI